jgi:hypothetical protein
MKTIEALFEAQKIAFSPFVFHTAATMLDLNIFEEIENNRKDKLTIEELAIKTNVSKYGITVLIEMAVASNIVEIDLDGKLSLSKIGYLILSDNMTKVNLFFTRDVCYLGLNNLTDAIKNGKPEGLKAIGDWSTVYEGLSQLPENIKKSWFDFDHYYSDNAFDEALKIIFKSNPKTIFDIGGNTGKWSIASTNHSPTVEVKILDLPGQIKLAQANINTMDAIKDRVSYLGLNILDSNSIIPGGADVYWMSQFLDCFSEIEIESILLKIKANCSVDADIYIMETFIDDQTFPAASFSLIATSLYFTAIANGNSKMYSKSIFKYIIDKAGFEVVGDYKMEGKGYHTILHCKLKKA